MASQLEMAARQARLADVKSGAIPDTRKLAIGVQDYGIALSALRMICLPNATAEDMRRIAERALRDLDERPINL